MELKGIPKILEMELGMGKKPRQLKKQKCTLDERK